MTKSIIDDANLDVVSTQFSSKSSEQLECIERLTNEAEERWADRLKVDSALTRSLVSFQANKQRAIYRWFKYKEAFSADLVEYFVNRFGIENGKLLDPFAGIGTALFAAGGIGMKAEGIELLPIGQVTINTKQQLDWGFEDDHIHRLIHWKKERPWQNSKEIKSINELRITRGAYPQETVTAIGQFLASLEHEDEPVKSALLFALLCVLESVSFTRKDGQYLRWDYRSGRSQGKKAFDKGSILSFDKAITDKLHEIISDLNSRDLPQNLFTGVPAKANIKLHGGSCLEIMPQLESASFDFLITSPPYCNRYDYTRTYALELSLLGVDEKELVRLRQEMLSCTVENRAKDLLAMNKGWEPAIEAADNHELLQSILKYLDSQKELEQLNNNGIPRMVRGYFYELACVIGEAARLLKSRAKLIMVNDNVRYAGASISVDIILSEIAEKLGFHVENILVLPNGKGNSSQQMGAHGRQSLRKCVYVWVKE
ncbi:MAG: site-specific DNA-methyltransferase [Planctomycetaceae bacterium]